jgi:hypothetical protein
LRTTQESVRPHPTHCRLRGIEIQVCFKDLSGAESSKKRAQGCLTFPGLATESLPHIEPVRDSEANVVRFQMKDWQARQCVCQGWIPCNRPLSE